MKQAFESRLNILLSELLNQIGVVSHSEYLSKGRKDVIIYHQGLAIVLEGSYDRQDAENDAKHRIEQLDADVAIAIHYPKTFAQDLTEREIKKRLKQSKLPVRIIIPEDISGTLIQVLMKKDVVATPLEDWYELDLNLLATLIQEVAQFVISEEVVIQTEKDVNALVDGFVNHLLLHQESEKIAENLYQALYRLYGFTIGEPSQIKEAIYAQATLALLLGSVYYESIRYSHKLDSLETLANTRDAQRAIEKATIAILKINYEPIFHLVRDMLRVFPPMERPFKKLINLACVISSQKALLRRDLAGKVYHKVVGDWALKKGLATFFTQVPAAYLLLHLTKPKMGRIADFACGSGTLLVAAYSAISAHYRLDLLKSGIDKSAKEIEHDFHIEFIKACHAFDVLGYASQITALNLALHSPETPIKKASHIYTMPLGYRKDNNTVSLGSLEFARRQGNWQQIFARVVKGGTEYKEHLPMNELLKQEPFDLIAMNPPFSRTTGRGGKEGGGLFGFMTDKGVRKEVLEDYKNLRDEAQPMLEGIAHDLLRGGRFMALLTDDDLRLYTSVWQAGEGLIFLYLADKKLLIDGKLCFVLPKTLLTGVSWFLARTLLAANYHIEYVIVSYEPDNYNFSESTSLSECMIVAKKVDKHLPNEETAFIILLNKPKTSMEAISLATNIQNRTSNYVEARESKSFVITAKRKEILNNVDNWGRFVFLPNPKIINEMENLLTGKLKIGDQQTNIPLELMGNIINSIGVDRHRFTDTFRFVDKAVPGSVLALKGGEEAQRRKMKISTNIHALPIIESGDRIFEAISGFLLVPERIRVDTTHVTSMLSDERIISNIFYVVRLRDETLEKLKAFCLWLNTTWGILTILANRTETHGAFISLTMSQWRLLPILDIHSLPRDKLEACAKLFDEFKDAKLARITDQYGARGEIDKLRLKLDSSFLKAFGIEPNKADLLALYGEIRQSLIQWIGE
jgi:hypothetical protein